MTLRKPRNGWYARYLGVDYRGTEISPSGTVMLIHDGAEPPANNRFTKHQHADAWVLQVRAEELDRLVQVSTIARYGPYFCQVDSIADDGTADLYFLRDVNGTSNRPAGFDQVGKWEFRTTAPVRELHDYHEKHRDILFDHWRNLTFGAGVNP